MAQAADGNRAPKEQTSRSLSPWASRLAGTL